MLSLAASSRKPAGVFRVKCWNRCSVSRILRAHRPSWPDSLPLRPRHNFDRETRFCQPATRPKGVREGDESSRGGQRRILFFSRAWDVLERTFGGCVNLASRGRRWKTKRAYKCHGISLFLGHCSTSSYRTISGKVLRPSAESRQSTQSVILPRVFKVSLLCFVRAESFSVVRVCIVWEPRSNPPPTTASSYFLYRSSADFPYVLVATTFD